MFYSKLLENQSVYNIVFNRIKNEYSTRECRYKFYFKNAISQTFRAGYTESFLNYFFVASSKLGSN